MKLQLFVVLATSITLNAAEPLPGIVANQPVSGRFVKSENGFMVSYDMTIPGTDIVFHMEPIPGGEIELANGRRYKVDPFWMSRYEVTWAEYKEFMSLYNALKQFEIKGERQITKDNEIDAITAPTPLYEPTFTFEHGDEPQLPAVTVTQYSAKQYSKWLSAITQLQHRLPSEAEWEHACRAGTTTKWHFGDNENDLSDYAWYAGTTEDDGARTVGQKKPNDWGLFDMHGNAAEWVLDGADDDANDNHPKSLLNAATDWIRPTKADHRKVCGGSWELPAAECQATSRMISVDEDWKEFDPNIPLSPWWFTTDPARGVGFRLIRPLKEVPREAMEEYWKIDHEYIQFDVTDRLEGGRGVFGLADKSLPDAIKALDD